MHGIIRTRVGYTGGQKANPTYRSLGNHTEAFQLDYDPQIISYETLLTLFWKRHNPQRNGARPQYKAAIFTHNPHQQQLAHASRDQLAQELGPLTTEIIPLTTFYLAEDYHQKYSLRHNTPLMAAFNRFYPDPLDFVNSTAAARINGYLAGYGLPEEVEANLDALGLSKEEEHILLHKLRHSPYQTSCKI